MKKTWMVLKNEIITVVTRRSFLLILLLVPLMGFALTYGVAKLQPQKAGGINPILQLISNPTPPGLEGYVDASGIIKNLPEDDKAKLQPFASEKEALKAYQRGEISAYYLISADYLRTGKIIYARADYNPVSGQAQSSIIRRALEFNLLGQDMHLLERIQDPLNVDIVSLEHAPQQDIGNILTYLIPYAVVILFYTMISSTASLMLNSITGEKQNRVLEIIITSVTPTQLLAGKIIALGLCGLLQTVVWSTAGLLLLRFSDKAFKLPASAFQIPTSILVWGAIFFLLGYGVYGSLMAGLGALVPNLKETSQATIIMLIPMFLPLVFFFNLINDSNGALSIGLSLFPLTAPMAMMTRLAVGPVAGWQLGVAVVLLLATIGLVIRSVAGLFRAQNLLSGQSFSLQYLFKALSGKA
jgi:ABC-2 type transport system permease protein